LVDTSKNIVLKINSPHLLKLSSNIFSGLDLSPNTLSDYQYRIGRFIEFINKQGFSASILLDYKRQLGNTAYSVSTKNKYLTSSRIFLRELYRQGFLERDLTVNIKGFKQSQYHKKDGLTDSDIQLIQLHCQQLDKTQNNIRLKAILSLLIYQGLRQIEICRLDTKDLQLHNRILYVKGKGQDDKDLVWLHPYTVKALNDYIKLEKLQSGYLFRSKSNYHKGERLTTKSIRVIIKGLLDDLGLEGTVHGFRHYFTTALIRGYKGELLTVAKYTRHRNIQMLEVYNDEVIRKEDLPRYFEVFNDIKI
jgi:integrase